MVKDCSEKKITEMVGFFSVIEEVCRASAIFSQWIRSPVVLKWNSYSKYCYGKPQIKYLSKNDARDLRQTKLISKEYFPALNTEINLYDDYIHCMSFDEKVFCFYPKR